MVDDTSGAVPADDDDATVDSDHVDVAAVQRGEGPGGHHGLRAARCPPATGHVQDPVDQARDGGDLVGDEHHGGAVLAVIPAEQGHDRLLGGRIEGEQRLVAQQQPRAADQRLGDPKPLLLPARQHPDRCARIGGRADRGDGGVDPAGAGPRQAAPVPVDAELDQVPAADRQVGVESPLLGKVADLGAAPPRRPAVDGDRAS